MLCSKAETQLRDKRRQILHFDPNGQGEQESLTFLALAPQPMNAKCFHEGKLLILPYVTLLNFQQVPVD